MGNNSYNLGILFAYRCTKHYTGADDHKILDDVLPFKRWSIGNFCKYFTGKKKNGRQGTQHLKEEQQERCPHVNPGKQAYADKHFPNSKNINGDVAGNNSEA